MKIAYLDTVAGIAGDMTLAAFISAGARLDELTRALKTLDLGAVELTARHVKRSSIDAVHLDVVVTHEPPLHRTLPAITSLIERSRLAVRVKERAIAVFRVLAEAEAHVHGTTADKVHFHEVGAIDSIIDVVGTALGLEHFGIERLYSSPVRLGRGGVIRTQHGIMPTPAPGTLEILKGYPVVFTGVHEELTTPTGAAIIKALSSGVLDQEQVVVQTIGYGAGTKEFAELPNFLRLVIGELASETERDDVVTIETNIDDMNPQVYPVLIERLLAAGAHDAYLIPIIMKKGRPGILLSVMASSGVAQAIIDLLYRETSTIGLRIQHIGRRKLPRSHREVTTSFGHIKAKAVIRDGKEVIAPEFEECRRIAQETGRPVLEILRALEAELGTSAPG